jgi:DNA helicase-2/ATP-dependent DNA helicase PcrA
MNQYDMDAPWNTGVRGEQVLPLINEDGGCIRCEAGPGTGKTFGLERRVVRLMAPNGSNLPASGILVVAFNRVIAKDLRATIEKGLKETGYEGMPPRISTLHSYCLEQLNIKSRVLLPHEEDAMCYDLLRDSKEITELYKDHKGIVKAYKRMGSGQEGDDLLQDQVERWLTRHNAGTIGDVPAEVLAAIAAGDITEKYDQVIVDEFQDLTPSEQQLVFKLVKDEGTITALGDRRQSIYRFRGNEIEGLSKIESISSQPVNDIRMTVCQRCPNTFVDAANIVQVSSDAPKLEYGNSNPDNTHVVVWQNLEQEAMGMAKHIVENLKARPDDKHLAMATRRAFGYSLRDEIKKLNENLVVRLVFSESPLETWAVREAFIAFCLLCAPDGPTWRSWLAYQAPKGTAKHMATERNSTAYLRLLTATNDSIDANVMKGLQAGTVSVSGTGQANLKERAGRYVEIEEAWKVKMGDPETLISSFFDPAHWPGNASDDDETVRQDFETVKRLALDIYGDNKMGEAEKDLRKTAASLRMHVATRDTEIVDEDEIDLTIATLWSAKGVTADHVYVLGLCEQAIPGEHQEDYPGTPAEHREEQQRLFYVSVTRSKRTLVLSRARYINFGDLASLKFVGAQPTNNPYVYKLTASPFLLKIMSALPAAVEGDKWAGCV